MSKVVFATPAANNVPSAESLPTTQRRGAQKEAAAFANFYAMREDGSRYSLGALFLYDDKEEGAALIEYLKQGPEAVKAIFGDFLSVDFNLAGQKGVGISLPPVPAKA